MVLNPIPEKFILNYRSDLMQLDGYSAMDTDSDCQPIVWRNDYNCGCGDIWYDNWSCQCDDDCPSCGDDIEPENSTWIGPEDRLLIGLWETLPEKGFETEPAGIEVLLEAGKLSLAPRFHLVGIEALSVEKAEIHPGLDAYVRQKLEKCHPGASVYMCDSGSAGSKFTRLAFGVVNNGQLEKGTAGTLRADCNELREFLLDWDAKNIPPEVKDEPDTGPVF